MRDKVQSLFAVIVLNIFMMIAFSILMEYLTLEQRIQNAQLNISEALDMAIEASIQSEELFTQEYAARVSSKGVYYDYANNINGGLTQGALLSFWNGSTIAYGNTYLVSWFFDENGRFPADNTELTNFYNDKMSASTLSAYEKSSTALIFQWLYGLSGSQYNHTNLTWANKNRNTKYFYQKFSVGAPRTATTNFKAYYDAVGKYQKSYGFVKIKDDSGTNYKMILTSYPTLASTGLGLDMSYNNTTSPYIMDNFISSVKVAKTKGSTRDGVLGTNAGAYTLYYLTPAALGVTYVPVEVLKPVFIANLDYLVRLNKHSDGNDFVDLTSMASATGCIECPVVINGVRETHTSEGNIINDGEIEYDLSTAQVKVDYFVVDFYNNTDTNQVLMGKLKGLLKSSSTDVATLREEALLDYTKNYDTYVNFAGVDGFSLNTYRHSVYTSIIARVSCKIKLHIPYDSVYMAWFRYINATAGVSNHYGIKLWDAENGIMSDEDGVWYTYTTYVMMKR